MKSSVQQYIGLFLTFCMILFCVIGIVSDGFTDFEFVKPNAVASAEAVDVEQNSSASTVSKVLGGYDEGEKITWENERVEFNFSSGDENIGYSIDSEGFFCFDEYNLSRITNIISTKENVGIDFTTYVKYLKTDQSWGTNVFRFSIPLDYVNGFDIVRRICECYDGVFKIDNVGLSVEVSYAAEEEGFTTYKSLISNKGQLYLNSLDRVQEEYFVSSVEEGYIFDGWYKDAEFKEFYSDKNSISSVILYNRTYWYLDELLYAKISPIVKLSFGNYYATLDIDVAVGTRYQSTVEEGQYNSISERDLINFMDGALSGLSNSFKSFDLTLSTGEFFAYQSDIDFIVNEDIIITIEFYKDINFYSDGELFHTALLNPERGFDENDVPIPQKLGYNFSLWLCGSSLEAIANGDYSRYVFGNSFNFLYTTFIAHFEVIRCTVTLDCKGNLGDYGNGLHDEHRYCLYGEGLELSELPQYGVYDFLGWYYDNGTPYEGESIFGDITLHAKWEIPIYTVKYIDSFTEENFNTVKYHRGDILDLKSDVLRFYNLEGYRLIFEEISSVGCSFDIDIPYYVDSDLVISFSYYPIIYSVSFFVDDELISSCSYALDISLAFPEAAEKEGYDIVWLFADGSVYDNTCFYNKSFNLYAKYVVQKRTVTLFLGDVPKLSFDVDYGTSINDVIELIKEKNYNVVSFDGSNLKDDCFVGDVVFEVAEMNQTDKVKNIVKNNWRYIAIVIGGVVLLVGMVSMLSKPWRKRK